MSEQLFMRGLLNYDVAVGCALGLMAIDLYYKHCYRFPEIVVELPTTPTNFHPVLNPGGAMSRNADRRTRQQRFAFAATK